MVNNCQCAAYERCFFFTVTLAGRVMLAILARRRAESMSHERHPPADSKHATAKPISKCTRPSPRVRPRRCTGLDAQTNADSVTVGDRRQPRIAGAETKRSDLNNEGFIGIVASRTRAPGASYIEFTPLASSESRCIAIKLPNNDVAGAPYSAQKWRINLAKSSVASESCSIDIHSSIVCA